MNKLLMIKKNNQRLSNDIDNVLKNINERMKIQRI